MGIKENIFFHMFYVLVLMFIHTYNKYASPCRVTNKLLPRDTDLFGCFLRQYIYFFSLSIISKQLSTFFFVYVFTQITVLRNRVSDHQKM